MAGKASAEWSLKRLAAELEIDPRTLEKKLAGCPQIQPKDKRIKRAYRLRDVLDHLVASRTGEKLDLVAEQARAAKGRADTYELNLARERGEMLPLDEVMMVWESAALATRAKLLALPTKCAPLVIGLDRIPLVRDVLERLESEDAGDIPVSGSR